MQRLLPQTNSIMQRQRGVSAKATKGWFYKPHQKKGYQGKGINSGNVPVMWGRGRGVQSITVSLGWLLSISDISAFPFPSIKRPPRPQKCLMAFSQCRKSQWIILWEGRGGGGGGQRGKGEPTNRIYVSSGS